MNPAAIRIGRGRIGTANGALAMPKETDPSPVLSEMALRDQILTLVTCPLSREGHGLYLPEYDFS